MIFYLIKLTVTVVLVVLVSEAAKRSTLMGGLFASIPLVSLLALTWVYLETGSVDLAGRLATSIFWLVLPSLIFFLLLPVLLRQQFPFFVALALSLAAMAAGYLVLFYLMHKFGIRI